MQKNQHTSEEQLFLEEFADKLSLKNSDKIIFVQRMLSNNVGKGHEQLADHLINFIPEKELSGSKIAQILSDKVFNELENFGLDKRDWKAAQKFLYSVLFPKWVKGKHWNKLWDKTNPSNFIRIQEHSLVVLSDKDILEIPTTTDVSDKDILEIPTTTDVSYSVDISLKSDNHLILLRKDGEGVISCLSPAPKTTFKTGEVTAQEQLLAIIINQEPTLSWLEKARGHSLNLNVSDLQELVDFINLNPGCKLWRREFNIVKNELSKFIIHEHNSDPNKNIVIGISGGSCSGKSWLAEQFERICPEPVCILTLDEYYKEAEKVKGLEFTYDNPKSIEFTKIATHLAMLKAGEKILAPKYDFISRINKEPEICIPARIIIVEGIFAFSDPIILEEIDFKVWVEADSDVRYQRRLDRDTTVRGRHPLTVEKSYLENVKPGYEKFIYPNRRFADMTIRNDVNSDAVPKALYALLAYCGININLF